MVSARSATSMANRFHPPGEPLTGRQALWGLRLMLDLGDAQRVPIALRIESKLHHARQTGPKLGGLATVILGDDNVQQPCGVPEPGHGN